MIKIDYLPEKYRDTVYFQIIKVKHDISTSMWSTTLETIMRIGPARKKQSGLYYKPLDVCLSSSILEELNLPETIAKIKEYDEEIKISF